MIGERHGNVGEGRRAKSESPAKMDAGIRNANGNRPPEITMGVSPIQKLSSDSKAGKMRDAKRTGARASFGVEF
jgi:hypothetical protein